MGDVQMQNRTDVLTVVSPMASVADLLMHASDTLAAAGIGTARLDAEVLLASACGVDRAHLYTRLRDPVSTAAYATFTATVARRVEREPLQYIVGHQEFWSLDFVVTADVLIPRPETELLVETTLLELRHRRSAGAPVSLCDLGTGSGCVAVALARELPQATVYALDVSRAALGVAATNARRHGVAARIPLIASDLFAALLPHQFDAIVANPPYLTSGELLAAQPELRWEPHAALDGGPTGLTVIDRLLHEAAAWLTPDGVLLMEIGAAQADAVTASATASGWGRVSVRPDYAGLPRVVVMER